MIEVNQFRIFVVIYLVTSSFLLILLTALLHNFYYLFLFFAIVRIHLIYILIIGKLVRINLVR